MKRKAPLKKGDEKIEVVLIGQVEELTGHDVPGTEDDGATYAFRYRDHSRGAS